MIGYSPVNSGVGDIPFNQGVIFTATTIKGKGKAPEIAADAEKSGVRSLPGAPSGYFEFLMLDGASSVALAHLNPSGDMKVEVRKLRHGATLGGVFVPSLQYINTYITLYSYPPRGLTN